MKGITKDFLECLDIIFGYHKDRLSRGSAILMIQSRGEELEKFHSRYRAENMLDTKLPDFNEIAELKAMRRITVDQAIELFTLLPTNLANAE